MPHIIVEYSSDIEREVQTLIRGLHETLSAQETIDIKRVKSRGIRIEHCEVGERATLNTMVHVTLKLLPGRSPELLKTMTTALQESARTHVASHPECKVTVEAVFLDEASYCA